MAKSTRKELSEYKGMWLFALFDLPMLTKEEHRQYTRFRNVLLKQGFNMLQFSVYARFCPSEEASDVHRKTVQRFLPPAGYVRLISITDHQFGKMQSFVGKKDTNAEQPPEQILLF